MDDLSERVEAQNQQSMNYTKQATNNTNKRFKEQDKVNQGTFSALAKAGGMSAKQINDITTAKSAEPQATAQSQAGVNITMSTPGSRGGSQGGSPGVLLGQEGHPPVPDQLSGRHEVTTDLDLCQCPDPLKSELRTIM